MISVANNKGGAGKTTTALNLSRAFSYVKKKVLLIDADQQATACCWRAVNQDESLDFQLMSMVTPILHTEIPALALRSNYDYIIIDCPPGGPNAGGKVTRSALMATDLCIIPVQPSGPDFWGADPMVTMLEEVKLHRPAFVAAMLINRKLHNTSTSRRARDQAVERFAIKVFDVEIGQREAINSATSQGKTVFETDPDGPAAKEYKALRKEIEHVEIGDR